MGIRVVGLLRATLIAVLALGSVGAQSQVANAEPDGDVSAFVVPYTGIKLPYPRGTSYNVNQTPGQYETCPGPSHCGTQDYWAYDFNLADGNWTSAVHSGTVKNIEFGHVEGGCADTFQNYANYVVLDHGDGASSIYWHLKYASNIVVQNQVIYQGQPLGGADTTGQVCGTPGTHLHFAVETTPTVGTLTNSVRLIFDEAGEPAAGTVPVSQNRAEFSATYLAGSEWVTLAAGQRYTTVGQWRNSGYSAWQFNVAGYSARLGTWNPEPGQDLSSLLGGAVGGGCLGTTNWLSCTRIRPTTDVVAPDQTGWFQFDLIGPPNPGVYKLYVRPVVEGVIWMEDNGVFWQVTR